MKDNLSKIPRHIAIIMDGNGRWAKKHLFKRYIGHQKGVETIRSIVKECSKLGVEALTIYAFSNENWGRPKNEVNALMKLLKKYLMNEKDDLNKNQVRIKAIGSTKRLPKDVQNELHTAIDLTKNNTKMDLVLALSYSGKSEIINAIQNIISDCKKNKISKEDITEASFSNYLYTKELPELDLLIRTGGDFRISNFLLWQIAYAEIYVTKTLWPDFDISDLHKAIEEFGKRDRRFGLVKK